MRSTWLKNKNKIQFIKDNRCQHIDYVTVDPYFRAIPIKVSDWHTLCFTTNDDFATNRVVVPYFVCFSTNFPSSWLSVSRLPSAILDGRISRDSMQIVIISMFFIPAEIHCQKSSETTQVTAQNQRKQAHLSLDIELIWVTNYIETQPLGTRYKRV